MSESGYGDAPRQEQAWRGRIWDELRRQTPVFSETVTISPGFAVRQYRCIAGVAPDFLATVS